MKNNNQLFMFLIMLTAATTLTGCEQPDNNKTSNTTSTQTTADRLPGFQAVKDTNSNRFISPQHQHAHNHTQTQITHGTNTRNLSDEKATPESQDSPVANGGKFMRLPQHKRTPLIARKINNNKLEMSH